jgi:alcohol dehydrogenase (cytochrome c)
VRAGRVEKGMPSFALGEEQLKALMTHLRAVAGTNPAMATAGLTGQNRKPPSAKIAAVASKPGTLKLTSGRTLEGTILNEGDISAVLLRPDKKFHFLERKGAASQAIVTARSNRSTPATCGTWGFDGCFPFRRNALE